MSQSSSRGKWPARSSHTVEKGSFRHKIELEEDFDDLGLVFDVDDHGRLYIAQVDPEGKGGRHHDMQVGDMLQAISGVRVEGLCPANEQLRQFMTLPRPLKVTFRRSSSFMTNDPPVSNASSGTGCQGHYGRGGADMSPVPASCAELAGPSNNYPQHHLSWVGERAKESDNHHPLQATLPKRDSPEEGLRKSIPPSTHMVTTAEGAPR
ncbi:unnamed protein product, partial [Discosporangium mesarthrocarpum]